MTVVDDDGSGKDGTPGNPVELFNAMRDGIDDQCHSTTNTTIKPKDIIDEVVTARGTTANLSAREDVHSKQDGTILVLPTMLTTASLQAGLGEVNLLADENFTFWSEGDTTVSGHWSAMGTPTVQRSGDGLADTNTLIGTMCMRVANSTGADGVQQTILDSDVYPDLGDRLDEVTIGFGCWVLSSVASHAYVDFFDGSTASEVTSRHTGGGSWEWLSGTHRISKSSSELTFRCRVSNVAGNVHFSGATAVVSGLAPNGWRPSAKGYNTLHTFFPGNPFEGPSGFRHHGVARPMVLKDCQCNVVTAPGSGNDVEVTVTTATGALGDQVSPFTGAVISGTATVGRLSLVTTTYRGICLMPMFGAPSTASRTIMRVLVGAVGDSFDLDVWVRGIQWERPLEDFLAYNDL